MYITQPPHQLPKGFLEIWTVIADANRQMTTRHELAKVLRISTNTLQRILVSGDVPDFTIEDSTRIIHAWVRTITRLAVYFDESPRRWIENIGITWNPTIQEISDLEISRLKQTAPEVPVSQATRSGNPPNSREFIPSDRTLIGLSESEPLDRVLPEYGSSFTSIMARRLLSVVCPDHRFHYVHMTPTEMAQELAKPDTQLVMGIGMPGDVSGESRGIKYLAFPGLYVPLASILIHPNNVSNCDREISSYISPESEKETLFLTLKSSPATDFLTGQCGVPTEQVLIRNDRDAIHETLMVETGPDDSRFILLIADVTTCLEARDRLHRLETFKKSRSVTFLENSVGLLPAYPLSVGVSMQYSDLAQQIETALREEFFNISYYLTARQYAALIALSEIQRYQSNPSRIDGTDSPIELRDFPEASAAFRSVFNTHILEMLSLFPAPHKNRLSKLLLTESNNVTHSIKSGNSKLLKSEQDAETFYCRSCLADLRLSENRGVSDRYCRFCSDEHGKLRSRAEVRVILGEWLCKVQGDISAEEATRRADLYMQAMPAWAAGPATNPT